MKLGQLPLPCPLTVANICIQHFTGNFEKSPGLPGNNLKKCWNTLSAFISTIKGTAETIVIFPFSFVVHFELVYLVTALVPSDTACLASSPGNRRRTAVCTSRLVIVERLLYWVRRDASVAILSKTSLTKEFMMLIALLEMPVSGWTCIMPG